MSLEKEPDIATIVRHDDPAAVESFSRNFSQLVTNMHDMAISIGKETDFPLDPKDFTEDKIQLKLIKEKAFKKSSQ